ncbi:MAG: hypothetical protein AAF492_03865, partial [Verrucomicrobiota bacterium]
MNCYITSTGSFLPGDPVDNENLPAYMGRLFGESKVREKILRVNGIKRRHYALDRKQNATHDVYELAALAAAGCLEGMEAKDRVEYLSAGSTKTPFVGPGLSSILHSRLKEKGLLDQPLEINSNSGICSSAAQAFVNASRAIASGAKTGALCVGVEQPSAILKSSAIKPPRDWLNIMRDVRTSKWFMSVFLRFMLSDGAGAFLLENRPAPGRISFQVDWTFSRSFAHEAPLCMKLEGRSLLLSQDVEILTNHMKPCVQKVTEAALETNGETLADYKVVLPHLSSFFFRKNMLDVF